MVLKNYQNLIEMTSNMIYILSLGVGFKFPHKIHLNIQFPLPPGSTVPGMYSYFTNMHSVGSDKRKWKHCHYCPLFNCGSFYVMISLQFCSWHFESCTLKKGCLSNILINMPLIRFWRTEKQKIIDYIFQWTSQKFLEIDSAILKAIKI